MALGVIANALRIFLRANLFWEMPCFKVNTQPFVPDKIPSKIAEEGFHDCDFYMNWE